MSNCIFCLDELKFINKPSTYGVKGKLNNGEAFCMSCFGKINKANSQIAKELGDHSLDDIKKLLNDKTLNEQSKHSRLEEIKTLIKSLEIDNASSFLGRKEIKELPAILAIDEKINNLIQGTYNNGQGILVSTDKRLVFIDKGIFYGLKVEDFPLDKITSIQYETGLLLGKVKIHTSGNITNIDNVQKASARKFAEFVSNKLSQSTTPTFQNNSEPNILEQIEKLGELKESGLLTEEEFNEQKVKLLGKL